MQKFATSARLLGVCAFFVFLGACSGGTVSDAERIRERAEAYWAAIVVGDYVTGFPYERVSVTHPDGLARYLAGKGAVRYSAAVVKDVQLAEEGQEATVTVTLTYSLPALMASRKSFDTDLSVRWSKVEGEWYNDPVAP